MSDGPYRSLPMSRPWKTVAKFAENAAMDLSQVSRAAVVAIQREWNSQISSGLLDRVYDFLEPSLPLSGQFENLRRLVSGMPLANYFLDALDKAICSGLNGTDALRMAANTTVIERTSRAFRQMEEHYLRNLSYKESKIAILRLRQALNGLGLEKLATRILHNQNEPLHNLKKTGIDEGVRIGHNR